MWNYECNETEIMNLRDSMEGVVRKQNSSGLYIDLKTNSDLTDGTEHTIPAFGYWTGRVPEGTKFSAQSNGGQKKTGRFW